MNPIQSDRHGPDPFRPTLPELWLTAASARAGDQLLDLYTWLGNEDDLRGRLALRTRSVKPGEMGGVLDVLTVAVASIGAGSLLAQSVLTWLAHQRSDVVITVSTPEGQQVIIDVRRSLDPAALIREIQDLIHSPDIKVGTTQNTIAAPQGSGNVQAGTIYGGVHIHPIQPDYDIYSKREADGEDSPEEDGPRASS
ncbi:hypothetical protein M8C13_05505 [Crossiella sp. SN42]|uniref:effector-associated constant component EACC1 n=1 Tax=Crossiella sp. SN42 TaxID=2944808 RepID=UPI00207D42C8|nr:hypothetical protein [Crossiella sp. SN42]MCO1575215.1 hypothetical protein [Crossiella sp. SN42]